jgi:hypothetical protein
MKLECLVVPSFYDHFVVCWAFELGLDYQPVPILKKLGLQDYC